MRTTLFSDSVSAFTSGRAGLFIKRYIRRQS